MFYNLFSFTSWKFINLKTFLFVEKAIVIKRQGSINLDIPSDYYGSAGVGACRILHIK